MELLHNWAETPEGPQDSLPFTSRPTLAMAKAPPFGPFAKNSCCMERCNCVQEEATLDASLLGAGKRSNADMSLLGLQSLASSSEHSFPAWCSYFSLTNRFSSWSEEPCCVYGAPHLEFSSPSSFACQNQAIPCGYFVRTRVAQHCWLCKQLWC